MKFSEQQIKNWLIGYFIVNSNNEIYGQMELRNIVDLIDDEHDGIAACVERGAISDNHNNLTNYTFSEDYGKRKQ